MDEGVKSVNCREGVGKEKALLIHQNRESR